MENMTPAKAIIVGVCTGGVIQIVMFIVGNVIVDMSLFCGILSAVLGGLICTGVAWLLQFFLHSVDYTKAEKVQFLPEIAFSTSSIISLGNRMVLLVVGGIAGILNLLIRHLA